MKVRTICVCALYSIKYGKSNLENSLFYFNSVTFFMIRLVQLSMPQNILSLSVTVDQNKLERLCPCHIFSSVVKYEKLKI